MESSSKHNNCWTKYQTFLVILLSIVVIPNILKNTKSFLLEWTIQQIDAGVPKHAICSMAKREFGNGNPLSNSTINRHFSTEYKDQTKIENAQKRKSTDPEKSKVSKIKLLLKSVGAGSLSEILEFNQALLQSSTYAKNRI